VISASSRFIPSIRKLTIDAVLLGDDLLEGVVDLGTHLHGFRERTGAGRKEHELLEGEGITSVRATVNDVESRAGEDVGLGDAGERGEVRIEGDALRISAR
jgi:hypothetical protein